MLTVCNKISLSMLSTWLEKRKIWSIKQLYLNIWSFQPSDLSGNFKTSLRNYVLRNCYVIIRCEDFVDVGNGWLWEACTWVPQTEMAHYLKPTTRASDSECQLHPGERQGPDFRLIWLTDKYEKLKETEVELTLYRPCNNTEKINPSWTTWYWNNLALKLWT